MRNLNDREYKLARIENQLKTQLNDNDETTITKIMERLQNVNTNKLNHEANETIRLRNLMR